MKNYKDLTNELEHLNYLKQIYTLLKKAGISYKAAEDFKFFSIDSSYSMGEITELRIKSGRNISVIFTDDNTEQYPGGKWKPTHGHIVVTFSRKELKEYIKLCSEKDTDVIKKYIIAHVTLSQIKNNTELSYIDVGID